MVKEPGASDGQAAPLTTTKLQCMTQDQLEELIPKLISKATGQKLPLFGSDIDRPSWWPEGLEWISPVHFAELYQNSSEKLREIVRSCYYHLDHTDLLTGAAVTGLSSDLPRSPVMADTDVCMTGSTKLSSDSQGTSSSDSLVVIDLNSSDDEQTDGQSEHQTNIAKNGEPCMFPENNKSVGSPQRSEGASNRADRQTKKMEISDKYTTSEFSGPKKKEGGNEQDNCHGVDLHTCDKDEKQANDNNLVLIHDDMLAQIDKEIEKSLKTALQDKNVLDFGNFLDDSVTLGSTLVTKINEPKGRISRPNILGRWGAVGKRLFSELDDSQSMSDSELTVSKAIKRRRMSQDSSTVLQDTGHYNQKQSAACVQNVGDKNTSIATTGWIYEKPKTLTELTQQKFGPGEKYESEKTKISHGKCVPDEKKESEKDVSLEEKNEDDVVWICFICAKSFADQAQLMEHQDVCEEETAPADSSLTTLNSSSTATVKSEASSVPGEKKGQSSSEKVLPLKETNTDQSSSIPIQPVPTLLRKVGSSLKSLPLGLPSKHRRIRSQKKFPDIYIPPPRDSYFEGLGLLQTPKVVAISKSPRKSVTDEDCQIIDLTVEGSGQPVLQMTPRTKSLMSQLSQDGASARKRQLSFSQNLNSGNVEDVKRTKAETSESESSEDVDEDDRPRVSKVPSKSAILGIPLTSLLGQRLKQHWNSEYKIPVISEVEKFCKTKEDDIQKEPEMKPKNPMVEKLRHRPPPQVTFKFSKKYINKWFHSYKFNKDDRHEFQKRVKTGLDLESRRRLKRMKPCKVLIQRVSKKDIKFWTNPRPKVSFNQSKSHFLQQQVYNSVGMTNGQPRFDSLRYMPPVTSLRRNVSNRPSYVTQRPRQTTSYPLLNPTPQLLVRTVPVKGQGMQVQIMPMDNFNSYSSAHSQPQLTHTQKRKQVFTNVKQDDMVICLSSDEEDNSDGKPGSCAVCKKSKESCSVHGRKQLVSLVQKSPSHGITTVQFQKKWKDDNQNCNFGMADQRNTNVNNIQHGNVKGQSFHQVGSGSRPSNVSSNRSEFRHMRISDGAISVVKNNESSPATSNHLENDHGKTDHLENKHDKTEGTSDGDFIDYEVICIDSDEET